MTRSFHCRKGSLETAWLASSLLDALDRHDKDRAAHLAGQAERLASRAGAFDEGTAERAGLLADVAAEALFRFGAAHRALLSHLAQDLLIQSLHGAA